MKSVIGLAVALCGLALYSCTDGAAISGQTRALVVNDTILPCCLASYDLTEHGDTINRTYGTAAIKHGHWIEYLFSRQGEGKPLVKSKFEEGSYKNGQRVGLWIQFGPQGEVRDSVLH